VGVDEYIEGAPEDRKAALKRIRSLCQQHLTDCSERIEYGMPSYVRGGEVEIAFASQRNNIALYVLKKSVLDKFREHFPKSYIGKGCIRYPRPEKIDFDLVEKMIIESQKSDDRIC